jgi:hypothetical protein
MLRDISDFYDGAQRGGFGGCFAPLYSVRRNAVTAIEKRVMFLGVYRILIFLICMLGVSFGSKEQFSGKTASAE